MRQDQSFHPIDLATLQSAVNSHCLRHKIVDDLDRETVASRALAIFRSGIINVDDIVVRLGERG
jgi:hypothetical protein